jgi:hypothetical protein
LVTSTNWLADKAYAGPNSCVLDFEKAIIPGLSAVLANANEKALVRELGFRTSYLITLDVIIQREALGGLESNGWIGPVKGVPPTATDQM